MSTAFQVVRKTTDAFILNLRRVFSTDPKYTFVTTSTGEVDFDNTKVLIADVIPQTHAFLPAIVVDVVSGPEVRYIGPDDLYEIKNDQNVVTNDFVFSSVDLVVNINVYTIEDTIARDEIIDVIYDHFKLDIADLATGTSLVPTAITSVPASGTTLGLYSTVNITKGSAIIQGLASTTVTSVIDSQNINVTSNAGFTLGAATYSIPMAGIEIKRSTFNPPTRTFVMDRWYIVAGISIECYTEWFDDLGVPATVESIVLGGTFNITSILDPTHFVVNSTSGMMFGDPISQISVLTGMVDLVNGSASVVGTGTLFTTQLVAGNVISYGNTFAVVDSITDDTHLTLTATWSGVSNTSATIMKTVSTTITNVVDNTHLQVVDTTGFLTGFATYGIQPLE